MKPTDIACITFLVSSIPSLATISVVGDKLNIGSNNSSFQANTAAIGHTNGVNAPYSLIIGAYNYIDYDDDEHGSFALGHHNYMYGTGSITGGSFNSVTNSSSITMGYYNFNNASASLVIGTGNVAEWLPNQNGIVAGKYCASVPNAKPAHLVIGNGTSSTSRSNSFVVYANGDIVITKPQGDISMGIYE